VVGFARRWVYPFKKCYSAVLHCWRCSNQWWIHGAGWVLTGANALFYPSLIIFAASLLLIAFRETPGCWISAKRPLYVAAEPTAIALALPRGAFGVARRQPHA
jgi:hypothetical protein